MRTVCSFRARWSAAVTKPVAKPAAVEEALLTLTNMAKQGRLDAITARPQWNVPADPVGWPGESLV